MSFVSNSSFAFYASYLDSTETLSYDEGNNLLRAIVEYGIRGSYSSNSPVVNAVMAIIKNSIDSSQARYSSSKICGSLGGRPKSADYTKLAEEHFKNGKSISQIAVAYSVSERTVQRALAKYQTEGSQINDESSASEEQNESSVPKQNSPLDRFYNDYPVEETKKSSSNSYYFDGDLDSNAKSKKPVHTPFIDPDDGFGSFHHNNDTVDEDDSAASCNKAEVKFDPYSFFD